jgi:hypothetical protein
MKTSLAIATAMLWLPFAASADESFRCGNWIASSDMTVDDLVRKCGEPTARTSRTEDVLVRNRDNGLMLKVGETLIETWTYDRGTQAAAMLVTIVDGRIKSIERQQ